MKDLLNQCTVSLLLGGDGSTNVVEELKVIRVAVYKAILSSNCKK